MKYLMMFLVGILLSQSLLAQVGRPIGKNDGDNVENQDIVDLLFEQVYLNVDRNLNKCLPNSPAFTHKGDSTDQKFAELYKALKVDEELGEKQKYQLIRCLVGDTTTFKKFTHHVELEVFLKEATKLNETQIKEAVEYLRKISNRKLKKGFFIGQEGMTPTKDNTN